ncbi:MAG: hypothetical protein Kow006_01820 [Gammaproteobacteria bacterium]
MSVKPLKVRVPLVFTVPDQAPEAIQLVASVALQVSVVLPLWAIEEGDALRLIVGVCGGGDPTFTSRFREMFPPGPEQVSSKLLSAVSAGVRKVPETPFGPDQSPEATQFVVF